MDSELQSRNYQFLISGRVEPREALKHLSVQGIPGQSQFCASGGAAVSGGSWPDERTLLMWFYLEIASGMFEHETLFCVPCLLHVPFSPEI